VGLCVVGSRPLGRTGMSVISWVLNQFQSLGFEMMISIYFVAGIIEHVIPVARVPAKHYALNLTYSVLNLLLTSFMAPSIALVVAIITRHFTHGLIDLRSLGFGGIGGAIVATLISTIIYDFFYYWMHRTQHTSEVLWQEHLLHHSDEHVNITTSGRTHVLEQVLAPIFITIPNAFLFALPPATITTIVLLPWIWAYIVHANVRIGFGPLWWMLAGPQYHRLHHSVEERHFNKNYAVWFPIWDILFGTVYKPEPGEYPQTGVDGVEVKSIAEAYLLPFKRWYGMLTSKVSQLRT
jgi:sterol desaturase/sphingolipid hydroxylase (fatty acid hydroxylase superfamily)